MAEIVVESVSVDGGVVSAEVSPSRSLERFFRSDTFWAEYDVDLAGLPESIATIPVLAQVCPVAWANGADVHAPVVDREFLGALEDVRETLVSLYPEFMEGGAVVADEVVDTEPDRTHDGSGLLFSGGVDSMTSYVRHRDEDPTLISVQGWTIDTGDADAWQTVQSDVGQFATARGLDARFVRATIGSFLDTPMLHAHFKRYLVGSWYSGVGHGLGLLGLSAPLAWRDGYDRVYIASTHWEGFAHPWGSMPELDDQVHWSGTRGVHDGYELTRQEKIERLAKYIRESGIEVPITTCNDGTGVNCSRCEKCCRTSAGLALAGLDPNDHGYDVDADTYQHAREQLASGNWIRDQDVRFQWQDIVNHAREKEPTAEDVHVPAAAEFFDWLAERDIDRDFVDEYGLPFRGRVIQTVARHVPYPVYRNLYPVYSTLKDET